MKKIIIPIVAFCLAFGAYAQEPEQTKQQKEAELSKQQSQIAKYEQVKSEKIAFFTTAMALTPQEAEAFWPIYNNFWKEREVAHKRIQANMRGICRMLTGEKAPSDNDYKKLLEMYVNGFASEGVIQRKYYDEFLKVLSIEKVAKLYKAEEDFRMKMIHQLRGENR